MHALLVFLLLAAGPGSGAQPVGSAPAAAALAKVVVGDSAFAAGDYRAALFAYQDAIHLSPHYAAARVKLGRAYLALRYRDQAIAQAEQVLSVDHSDAEAQRLLEDARSPPKLPASAPARPAPPVSPPAAVPAAAPTARVFRFVEEPAADPAPPPPEPAAPSPSPPAPAAPPESIQWYRLALDQIAKGDPEKAIPLLDHSISADPRFVDAHLARADAQLRLGEHRAALDGYRAALALDPDLAAPLYGAAECHRLLGDARGAAELYQRYAESTAKDVREDLRASAAERARKLR